MRVADEFLGTREDPDVAARLDDGNPLTVTLDDTERRRSRVRTTAEDGTDLGVVVGRELRDGDVLAADGRPVVVSLEPVEALVLDLAGVDGDPTLAATAALALGHAVGNRHWDLAVDGARAYLPVAESRERMESEVRPHLPDGATVGYESVSPALFDDGAPEHSHEHGHDHSHEHGHDHSHEHRQTSGGSHVGNITDSFDGNNRHSHDHPGTDHAVRPLDPDGGEES